MAPGHTPRKMDAKTMLEPSSVLLHEELFAAAERGDVDALQWMLVADPAAAFTARRERPDTHGQRHVQSPLLAACAAGSAAAVELLCARLYPEGGGAELDPGAGCDDTPLHAAARCGRLQVVELLLSKRGPPGLEVDAQTKDGSTAFSLACRHGYAPIARALHSHGIDNERVTHRGATPFLIACQEGHAALAEWLATDCGADTARAADGGFNPFYMACQNGHVDVVGVLVRLGLHCVPGEDMVHNTFGTSPFYIAAQNGHLPLLQYLMSQDGLAELGWLHQPENNGATPFYICCEQGHVDVARFLAHCNADVEAANANSSSPLFIACLKGHLAVVDLLVKELHVDCERPNSNGATPFYVSCEKGHMDVIRYLGSQSQVNVATTNANGVSPLWIACQDGHISVVEYCAKLAPELLEQPKASGATPFCIAAHQGHLDLVEFLAAQGVDMTRSNHNGATPLFYAATNGHLAVVQTLLKRGVSGMDTSDSDGVTPFMVACRQGHVSVAEALADEGADIEARSADNQSALEVAKAHDRRSVVSWLTRIQSVPSTTPRLVAARQRLALSMVSGMAMGATACTLQMSYDLLETIGKLQPARVTWQFAMKFVQSSGAGQTLPATQIAAPPIGTDGRDLAVSTLLLTRPVTPPRVGLGAGGGGGGGGGRGPGVDEVVAPHARDASAAGSAPRIEQSSCTG